jgi:peptidoglycan/xylan/chitin deacetylase (PgdA/CDA1 family)
MFWLRKYEVVTLGNYNPNNPRQVVLRFDDGYKGVVKYALPILKFFNYPFEVFIVEKYYNIGNKGNKTFMNREDLGKILKNNGHLQYHTKTHPDLTTISDEKTLREEIICPNHIKILDEAGFNFFAYPYWKYNTKILKIVRDNYQGGLSGNGFATQHDHFALDCIKTDSKTRFKDR